MLAAARGAEASVSYVNSASASATNVATVTIPTFNPGGAANRVLVVGLTFGQGVAPTNVAVKYGGVSLTLAPGTSATNGSAHTEIWYLTDPSLTPASIVATWTGNHDVVMGATAFAGADQLTPVVNGVTATGNSTSPSVTITSLPATLTAEHRRDAVDNVYRSYRRRRRRRAGSTPRGPT